jgi:hypothetical protein
MTEDSSSYQDSYKNTFVTSFFNIYEEDYDNQKTMPWRVERFRELVCSELMSEGTSEGTPRNSSYFTTSSKIVRRFAGSLFRSTRARASSRQRRPIPITPTTTYCVSIESENVTSTSNSGVEGPAADLRITNKWYWASAPKMNRSCGIVATMQLLCSKSKGICQERPVTLT